MAKYWIQITEDMYGTNARRRINCPVASEVVLKRMWKHYSKVYRYMDSVAVYALMEDENGLCDLSDMWSYHEYECAVNASAIRF